MRQKESIYNRLTGGIAVMNNRSEVVKSWFLSGRRKPFFRILIVMLLISVMAAGCAPAGPTVPATDPVPSATETPTESPSASLSTDVPVTEPTVPPSTEPTTPAETEATTPAETEPTEPASETPEQTSDSHPEETRPQVEVEKRVSLSADQMGVMMAQQEYCWTADAEGGSAFTTGAGAEDFYYSFLLGIFMLHEENNMMLTKQSAIGNPSYPLNCTHPKRLLVNMEAVIIDGAWRDDWVRVFYVLCDEGLLRIVQKDPGTAPEEEDCTVLPLPYGVSLQDIRELGVHEYRWGTIPQTYLLLMTYQQGNFFLDRNLNWRVTNDGYQINWKDDETLEIFTDTVCWTVDMPKQQVWVLDQPTKDDLVICVKQEEEDLATVYDYRGESCLASTIDMSDWVSIPERFAHRMDGGVYVLAPKADRVELLVIEPGVTSVMKTENTESAEKILEIANSYDLEEKEGLVIAKHTAGNSGPRDFAVIDRNDILVLQTSRLGLQRYVNDQYQKTYVFQETDTYEYVETDGEYAYVIGWEKLLRIDLNTGEEESFPYPPAMRAPTAVWADGCLVLQNELCGNYVFRDKTGAFEKTDLGFSTEWNVSSSGTSVLIKYGNSSWKLDATDIINVPVAVDGSGNLIVYVTNEKRMDEEDYISVQTIPPTGYLQAKVNVDQSNHFFTPLEPVKMQKDGKVYIMCVYEPYTAVYALPATDCIVSEPDIAVPER